MNEYVYTIKFYDNANKKRMKSKIDLKKPQIHF
jgi:hypothetical protein